MTAAVVTLLFTDIVGSTDLYQRLGEDAAEEVRRGHFRLLRDAVVSVGGQEVKNLGDGLMVVFESPIQAVACAVAMQQAVQRRQGTELKVRVGLHVGEPIRDEEDFFGTPVAAAKRLCDAADGGQIYASELVRSLVGSRGSFDFRSVGDLSLKGLSEPMRTYEVAWLPASAEQVPLPGQLEVADRVALVGRYAELESLKTTFKEAVSGRVRLALLAGEPGIGKTRLASEFSRWAHQEGATVLLGRCDEEPLAAYQPVVEALSRYVKVATSDDLRANTGRHAPTLAQLVPEVRERLPSLPEPLSGDPETERMRIFDAITAVLHGLAKSAPVVVLFDDIHWAQQPLLLLIRHLLRDSDPASLMLIGTYRDSELGRSHPLSEMLAELRRLDEGVSRIGLRGLDPDGVVSFMEDASGHDLDAEAMKLARSLHETTEGNPFFLREVLRHLTETGALVQDDGRWSGSRPAADIGLPEGVKEVVGRRLSRLSEDSNKALRVAAVIGREFDLELLASVASLDVEHLLTLVEEAVDARVVTEVNGAIDRFSFAHALVRETLIDELTTSRRVRVHRLVGEAIEGRFGDDLGPHVAQLAYHFGEAADTDLEKAIGYAQRAAAEATDVHSYEEAAAHCERALEWLDASGVPNDRLRCELLISLAQVQLRYIGYTTSRETIRSALEPARALGDHDLIARVALTFAGRYGVPGRADPEIVSVLEDALALMDEAEIGLRAGLTSRLGIEYMLPDPARAAELTMEGLRLADEYGDPNVQAVSLWDYSWIFAETDPVVDDWLKLAANLRRYGIEGGDAWVAVAGRWFDMYSELLRGNLDEAKLARDTYLREAVEFRVMQGRYFEALSAAMFALFEGRIEEADVLVHRALAVGQETEEPLAMNQYGAQLLILRWLQGRSVELIPMLQTLISTDPHVPWWAALALCQAMSDQLDDARSTIEDHLSGGIGSLRLGANRVVALGTVAIVAWMLRDERWAEDLYAALLPLEGLNTLIGVPGAISLCGSHYLAMLSSLTDRWEDYDRHVNDAFEMYDRMSARPWKMLLQGEVAVDLSRRGRPGDQGRAAEVLESAITGGRELGVDIDSILKPVTKDLKAHL